MREGQQEIRQEMREGQQETRKEMREGQQEIRQEMRDIRQEIRDGRGHQRHLIIATWTVGGGIIIALATLIARGGLSGLGG